MAKTDPFGFDMSISSAKKKTNRGRRGMSGASETSTKVCEHPGCEEAGLYRAPKAPDVLDDYYWFCQQHVREYNLKWNFFDGMTESEAKAFSKSAEYGHRKTWKFGTGPVGQKSKLRSGDPRIWAGIDGVNEHAIRASKKTAGRTRLQVRALGDLDLPENATALQIRERYSDYVKKFHPDANGGDRSSEHKLARVIKAFKTLKAAGLTQED